MAFRLPTFNIVVNVWRFGNPTTNPPDVRAFANLTPGRRIYSIDATSDPLTTQLPAIYLLLPTGSDVRGDVNTNGSPDTVEVPAGSSRFYLVHYVDYVALGFANEHLFAVIRMVPGSGPPVPSGELLLEDGTDALLEDGTPILLE